MGPTWVCPLLGQHYLECGALGPYSLVTVDSVLTIGQCSGYYHTEEGVAPTTASWDGLRYSLIDIGVSVQAGLKPSVLLVAS